MTGPTSLLRTPGGLPEPLPSPVTVGDARAILEGHRTGERGLGFRHADRMAEALAVALAEIEAARGTDGP